MRRRVGDRMSEGQRWIGIGLWIVGEVFVDEDSVQGGMIAVINL